MESPTRASTPSSTTRTGGSPGELRTSACRSVPPETDVDRGRSRLTNKERKRVVVGEEELRARRGGEGLRVARGRRRRLVAAAAAAARARGSEGKGPVVARRPAVFRRFHAIDATRFQESWRWVVSF